MLYSNKVLGDKTMLELRALCDNDIPLVESWINKKHVKRWYEIPHLVVLHYLTLSIAVILQERWTEKAMKDIYEKRNHTLCYFISFV